MKRGGIAAAPFFKTPSTLAKGNMHMRMHIAITTALALFASSGLAAAGSLEANSGSSSKALAAAESASRAVSSSQGGNVTFNTPGTQSIRNSGTTTIRSAPQVVAPSMSSGHPCAWAPLSMGISVVGFGGALGGQRIDDACLLAQMGVRDASVLMIAQRNPRACQALLAVGRVRSCGGRQATTAYPTASQQPQYVKASSLKKGQLYRKTPGGKLYRKG